MAVFFKSEDITCEKCGGILFFERELKTLSEDSKNKELKPKYFGKDMVCANCGKPIATVDAIGMLRRLEV
nr:MAG TPA: 24-sterol C-methyltransferase [Caudoviricetes sp.]